MNLSRALSDVLTELRNKNDASSVKDVFAILLVVRDEIQQIERVERLRFAKECALYSEVEKL